MCKSRVSQVKQEEVFTGANSSCKFSFICLFGHLIIYSHLHQTVNSTPSLKACPHHLCLSTSIVLFISFRSSEHDRLSINFHSVKQPSYQFIHKSRTSTRPCCVIFLHPFHSWSHFTIIQHSVAYK